MDQWQERKRPVCLERRYEFESYNATRNFLDRLGELVRQPNASLILVLEKRM